MPASGGAPSRASWERSRGRTAAIMRGWGWFGRCESPILVSHFLRTRSQLDWDYFLPPGCSTDPLSSESDLRLLHERFALRRGCYWLGTGWHAAIDGLGESRDAHCPDRTEARGRDLYQRRHAGLAPEAGRARSGSVPR